MKKRHNFYGEDSYIICIDPFFLCVSGGLDRTAQCPGCSSGSVVECLTRDRGAAGSSKVGQNIPSLVFTCGIFRYFPAWQIKRQIMAKITFCREILANMIFSCKMQQISLGS